MLFIEAKMIYFRGQFSIVYSHKVGYLFYLRGVTFKGGILSPSLKVNRV